MSSFWEVQKSAIQGLEEEVEILIQGSFNLFKHFDLDLTPAAPVGFNVTFQCPEGYVFNSDWFATPFLMMTCQVCSRVNNQKFDSMFQSDGSFDVPDWEAYQCVLRKRY